MPKIKGLVLDIWSLPATACRDARSPAVEMLQDDDRSDQLFALADDP